MQKLLTIFQQKISAYLHINVNFNELLTNDVVSFEQLGPGVQILRVNTVGQEKRPFCHV